MSVHHCQDKIQNLGPKARDPQALMSAKSEEGNRMALGCAVWAATGGSAITVDKTRAQTHGLSLDVGLFRFLGPKARQKIAAQFASGLLSC